MVEKMRNRSCGCLLSRISVAATGRMPAASQKLLHSGHAMLDQGNSAGREEAPYRQCVTSATCSCRAEWGALHAPDSIAALTALLLSCGRCRTNAHGRPGLAPTDVSPVAP
jgi:hypothetical protein